MARIMSEEEIDWVVAGALADASEFVANRARDVRDRVKRETKGEEDVVKQVRMLARKGSKGRMMEELFKQMEAKLEEKVNEEARANVEVGRTLAEWCEDLDEKGRLVRIWFDAVGWAM